MKIESIRIYAEVLEQGFDFKEYLMKIGLKCPIYNVYTKKICGNQIISQDSLITRIRKSKDIDVLITAINSDGEFPLLIVEYSTAVPTDDHKMQRSDVYYWGAAYKTPCIKIYPDSKGMGQDFGGGDRITDNDEIIVANKIGAVFYPIRWQSIPNFDVLETKPNALSCIKYNSAIQSILSSVIDNFCNAASFEDSYEKSRCNYAQKYNNIFVNKKLVPKSLIADSTRFNWDNDNLTVKINRFGHAMDPDRGVLFFANMLLGAEHTFTEFQINRSPDFSERCGYKSLFDAAPHEIELSAYVQDLIRNQNNIFTEENALHILSTAFGISETIIKKVRNNRYAISDCDLYNLLITHSSMAVKSIFFLSSKIILSDKDRKHICTIEWNVLPIKRYLSTLYVANFNCTVLTELTNQLSQEDVVTFAGVELFKKMQCQLLAVSYPGAQGDRCILYGTSGRKVLRCYIDIIAYKQNNGVASVFLEECKANISNSMSDAKKLNDFICDKEKMNGLQLLYKKVTGNNCKITVNIGIGAKHSFNPPAMDVDYIFMFNVDNSYPGKTIIFYNVAIINTKLVNDFSALADVNGKLVGSIDLPKIYAIK